MKTTSIHLSLATLALAALVSSGLHAEDADLAKKLSNPIASLISVPIQSNYDFGIGPGDGAKSTTNIQPVRFFAGVRSYLDKPDGGPGWGPRFGLTFLFPKS